MKKYSLLLLTLVLLALSGICPIGTKAEEKTLSGKDFVTLGKQGTVSGSLLEQAGEWYVKDQNAVYGIHMGNRDFQAKTGIPLKNGKNAIVTGFIYGKDIAVCTITIDHKKFRFRADDGSPLWAGSGLNQNQNIQGHSL